MAKFRTRVLAASTTLALVSGLTALSLATPAAVAAPLPAPYSASAHGDLVGLSADIAGLELAAIKIAHSSATADSDPALVDNSVAESKNVEAAVAGFPVPVDTATATAPPSEDPPSRALLAVPLAPIATVGAITGDVVANYTDASSCVPAVAGERILGDSITDLAGVTLATVPGFGSLASVGASQMRTTTKLGDDAAGGSDVVSTSTTSVGDINLLGTEVQIDVSSPVTLRATSDGTTGTAGFDIAPTVIVTVAGVPDPIAIPLNGTPVDIDIPALPLADVTITGFNPTDTSSGGTGSATLQSLLRVQIDVLAVIGPPLASVDLSLVPMSVSATAPSGGVECGVADTTAPAAPVIAVPTTGGSTTDTTPPISGNGAEPGSTVTVYDTDGTTVLCTDEVVGADGLWSCTPGADLALGSHTITATSTDAAGNESDSSAPVTFTIIAPTGDTTPPDAPVIIDPTEGSTTNDLTPTVNGTAEAGSTVTVTEGPLTICTAVAGPQGNWTCTPTVPLLPGAHTFSATGEDAAGNTSPADTVSFTITAPGDTTAPPAPVIVTPAEGSSTADTTPTISGTAEADSTVRVTEGGTTICTAQTDAQGNWSCTPTTALPVGPHTVTATATDAAGNVSPADSATFTVSAGGSDADNDGLPLDDESTTGTDPNNPDTDGDGLTDGAEVNGMVIKERFEVCGQKAKTKIRVTTNPLVKDTDTDGLTDGKEVRGYQIKQRVTITRSGKSMVIGKTRSNPTKADTDKDGLEDMVEAKGSANKKWNRHKTDPTKCDTDQGGVSDGREIKFGSDPAKIKSGPNDLESRMAARREGRGTIG